MNGVLNDQGSPFGPGEKEALRFRLNREIAQMKRLRELFDECIAEAKRYREDHCEDDMPEVLLIFKGALPSEDEFQRALFRAIAAEMGPKNRELLRIWEDDSNPLRKFLTMFSDDTG